MARPTSIRVGRAADDIGENFAAWRKLQSITSAQLAERAGISRSTRPRPRRRGPARTGSAMTRILAELDEGGTTVPVGELYSAVRRRTVASSFAYDRDYLARPTAYRSNLPCRCMPGRRRSPGRCPGLSPTRRPTAGAEP